MTRNNKFAMLIKQRKMLKVFETFSLQILFAELLFSANYAKMCLYFILVGIRQRVQQFFL